MAGLINRYASLVMAVIGISLTALCPVTGKAVSSLPGPQAKPTPTPLAESEGIVLPIRYDPPAFPFITIQARLDNSEPLLLVVDTGCNKDLILAPWAQQQLKLKTMRETDIEPGAPRAKVVAAGHLKLLDASGASALDTYVPNPLVAEIPGFKEMLGPKIAGVMGGEIFNWNHVNPIPFSGNQKGISIFVFRGTKPISRR